MRKTFQALAGVLDASHAEVEFVARYRIAGKAVRLHEHSRFIREDGRWYYVDGNGDGRGDGGEAGGIDGVISRRDGGRGDG